jgi:DNA/RNA-binding domain of Phe-tRNA-synthetase-like protein
MRLYYSISEAVFAEFPEYCRGVVVAQGIRNGGSPDELVSGLRAVEHAIGQQLFLQDLTTHPRIHSWREAYRSLGVKPSEYHPSVEALLRRVVKGNPLPSISRIVDLSNLVSVQDLLPVGAHAIDVLTQDIELRYANGQEIFEPFGTEAVEHPLPGEIIFAEGNTVLTRRWTWRQAKHTLVLPETVAVEINVDGLPPVSQEEVEQVCEKLAALVQKYCAGDLRYEILTADKPLMLLS